MFKLITDTIEGLVLFFIVHWLLEANGTIMGLCKSLSLRLIFFVSIAVLIVLLLEYYFLSLRPSITSLYIAIGIMFFRHLFILIWNLTLRSSSSWKSYDNSTTSSSLMKFWYQYGIWYAVPIIGWIS